MRLRNVKNKQEIMEQSPYLIENPTEHCGNWLEVFGNSNPIYIEIGMGKGNFIIQNAISHPEINYIGIEKYDSVIARALEKVPENIPNLRMIRMNAIEIDKVFEKEVDLIYLNFSDPWPKSRHAQRRLTSHIFLNLYDSVFKNVNTVVQKTDNRSLFEFSLESLSLYGYYLTDISLDLHNSMIAENFMTEYEEKFVQLQKPIYRVVASKNNVKQ